MSATERSLDELIGWRVGQWRQAVGLTQAELAESMAALGHGWVQQTVAQVEVGRRALGWDELASLAAYFEISPVVLLVGPPWGPRGTVARIGDETFSPPELAAWWTGWRDDQPPGRGVRGVIGRVAGKVPRPWAQLWRKRGGPYGPALMEARERALAARSRMPGPTFVLVGKEPTTVSFGFEPFSIQTALELRSGVPYVCRDEHEAEALARAQESGLVRRVSPQEAFRLRKRARSVRHRGGTGP